MLQRLEPTCLEPVSTATAEASANARPCAPTREWPQPTARESSSQATKTQRSQRNRGRAWKSLGFLSNTRAQMERLPQRFLSRPTAERTAITCPRWSLHTSDLSGFMSKGQSRNNPNVHHVMSGYKQNGVHPLGILLGDEMGWRPRLTNADGLGSTTLSERSQTRRPLLWDPGACEMWASDCQGLGGKGHLGSAKGCEGFSFFFIFHIVVQYT